MIAGLKRCEELSFLVGRGWFLSCSQWGAAKSRMQQLRTVPRPIGAEEKKEDIIIIMKRGEKQHQQMLGAMC